MNCNKQIFFTSDPHYGHINIIKFCNRPYEHIHYMNKDLTERWNSVVSDGDDVYMLGDFCRRKPYPYLEKLNGNIIWIRGNHDRTKQIKEAKKMGIPVYQRTHFEYGGYRFLLNHKPVLFDTDERSDPHVKNLDGYDYVLCGHVHEKWKVNQKNINVGVDVWDFTPVNIKDIIKLIKEIENEKN